VYWWTGLLLGSAPSLVWYGTWAIQNPQAFRAAEFVHSSLEHFWTPGTPPRNFWYHPIQILKFSVPWLLFWSYGLRHTWENRIWGWAKLVLVWAGVYTSLILVLANNLPFYILPVYPALALAGGAYLADIWHGSSRKAYPRSWSIGLLVLGLGAIAGSIGFAILPGADRSLAVICACVALTAGVAAVLVARRDLQFILILFWGMYISLLLFMTSPYWSWELEAAYPVKAISGILNKTPKTATIYASLPSERPALTFYSDRQIIPAFFPELKKRWKQEKSPYLLLDTKTFDRLKLESVRQLDRVPGWVLITKKLN